jgi:hypothetical protein
MPVAHEIFIRRVPFFQNLPPHLLEPVAQAFEFRRYNPGEVLFRQGSATRGMFLLLEGRAVLTQTGTDGVQRQLGVVQAGQYINHEALFRDGIETASLHAMQPISVLFLARRNMVALLAHYRDLGGIMGIQEVAPLYTEQFKTKREDEETLLKIRRHWWAYGRWLPLPLILAIGIGFLGLLMPPLRAPLLAMAVFVPGMIMLYLYAEWANDQIIITDQRLIRITRTILTLSEVVNEIKIDSIQEANAEVPPGDPFALLFNYGIVEIKTAGEAGNFFLDFIPNPDAVQELIIYDRSIRKAATTAKEQQNMRQEVQQWIQGSGQPASANTKPKPAPTNQPIATGPLQMVFDTPEGRVYRRHWFVWLRSAFVPCLFLLVGSTIFLLDLLNPTFQNLGVIGWALGLFFFLIGAVWFAYADWDWRNDYLLVSDTTVTIIHQRPLWLQNERDKVLLKQVDNVVAETTGIFQRLFGYGNLRLSLIGADQYKMFNKVPHPLKIQADITSRQARLKKRDDEERDKQERQRLSEYFAIYHQMQGGQPQHYPPGQPVMYPQQPTRPPAVPPAGAGNPPIAAYTAQNAPIQRQNPQPPAVPGVPSVNASPANSIPNYDRNRPPNIGAQRPTMSPGVPYAPTPGKPPAVPRHKLDGDNPANRSDSGRPPRFPRRNVSE